MSDLEIKLASHLQLVVLAGYQYLTVWFGFSLKMLSKSGS